MCMNKTFTQEDYLRIIQEEEELLSRFSDRQVNQSQFSPSKSTINNILGFSKALSLQKSKSLKYIEVVLN